MVAEVIRSLLGPYTEYFAAVGTVATSYIAFKICFTILNFIRVYGISRLIGYAKNLKTKGEWAGKFRHVTKMAPEIPG